VPGSLADWRVHRGTAAWHGKIYRRGVDHNISATERENLLSIDVLTTPFCRRCIPASSRDDKKYVLQLTETSLSVVATLRLDYIICILNKANVDNRLRPRRATHDAYLLIFIAEQNVVEI